MSLTALAIKNARPKATAYKLTDEKSLFLLVMPNGAKYWRMRYRYLGKQKTLSFGVWPEVSLADAREKRDAARKQIAEGLDPAAEKKLKRIRAQIDSNNTFKSVAEEWVLKCEREERAKRTLEKIRWLLDMAYPLIGTRPINDIEVQEVLVVLRKLEATGRYESARRMRSVISRVFRYGSRTAFEQRTKGEMIWAMQPEDFGTAGYGKRRARAIRRHFDEIVFDRDELLWLFDYWRPYSEALRQYLWAHNAPDVDRARRLIVVLPPITIRAILDYLVRDYWGRYLGWPDMLLWRGDDILMIEVKSSSDRLSGDQKSWIADNATILKLPFRIVKVHRRAKTKAGNAAARPKAHS